MQEFDRAEFVFDFALILRRFFVHVIALNCIVMIDWLHKIDTGYLL